MRLATCGSMCPVVTFGNSNGNIRLGKSLCFPMVTGQRFDPPHLHHPNTEYHLTGPVRMPSGKAGGDGQKNYLVQTIAAGAPAQSRFFGMSPSLMRYAT